MCRSEPHTPARESRTRMAPASTSGTGYSRSSNSPPYALSTATRPFIAPLLHRIRGGAPLSLLPRAPPPAWVKSGQEIPTQGHRIRGGAPLSLLPRAAPPVWVPSGLEVRARGLPHPGGELQAPRVDALVVAVEQARVVACGEAQRGARDAVAGS